MNFIEDLKRLRKIHELISGQNTGSPEKLAAAICVSRSEAVLYPPRIKKDGCADKLRQAQTFILLCQRF